MPIVKRVVGHEVDKSGQPLTTKELNEHPYYYFINHGDFDIVWTNVAVFVVGHFLFFYSYSVFAMDIENRFMKNSWKTVFFTLFLAYYVGISIGAGVHRLWAHRSYEAKWPLRLFLLIGQTLAGQNCVYIWCRDHRVHHKWSDTDADPHNTKRGYFFTHVGWLLRKKHPEMKLKSKTLDFSDLLRDPLVKFQADYYWQLYIIFSLYIPLAIPVYCWGEDWWTSFLLTFVGRYIGTLHLTWFVNSTAHMFGAKPYNENIAPVENSFVSFGTFGEGYHNYHHTFPWDYRAAEDQYTLNTSMRFIDKMASWGQAFNLKKTNKKMVEAAKEKISSYQKVAENRHSHIEVNYEEATATDQYNEMLGA